MNQKKGFIVKVAVVIIILAVIGILVYENRLASKSKNGQIAENNSPAANEILQPSPDFPKQSKVNNSTTGNDNTYVFDSCRCDATGDGVADDIILIGEKSQETGPFVQNIKITLKDGKSGTYSSASVGENNTGYDPKIFIGRFDDTGIYSMLVSFVTGSSGGISEYSLFNAKDGQLTAVIPQKDLNKGLLLDIKFNDGFLMTILDRDTGYKENIDISKNKEDLIRLRCYDESGRLLENPMGLVDSFGVLQPVDTNKDGIYELRGLQDISAAYHANRVATAESIWSVSKGKINLLEEKVTPQT